MFLRDVWRSFDRLEFWSLFASGAGVSVARKAVENALLDFEPFGV